MTVPYVYGEVDPLADSPRYTSVAAVKTRIGIPTADTTKDAAISQAIVAAEYALDVHFGRSFPDPATELAAGPWKVDTASLQILDPAAGELNINGTAYELSKTDGDAVDHSGISLAEDPLILISWPVLPSNQDALIEVSEVTDAGTFWRFTGTLRLGVIPPDQVLNSKITINNQSSGGIGKVQGIPEAVKQAALSVSIAVYKSPDAPVGAAGSEEFFGVIDVADIARRVITRDPTLIGFRISSGFGVA